VWTWFHKLSSPPHFYRLSGTMIPWFGWLAALLIIPSLYAGLVLAPADYQQGEGFRIIYVHVPAAMLSLFVYMFMATAAAIGMIWRMKLAHSVAVACAPIGASFTFLALATGSIWGKPMWGTWWAWDARLTAELILLFLYLGYMGLRAAIDDTNRADRASAILALVGVVNVPIVHYSVTWWNSLHQASTLLKKGGPSIPPDMAIPLYGMILGFMCFFGAVSLTRVKREVLVREQNSKWVKDMVASK
jgi:heme exporter protein C